MVKNVVSKKRVFMIIHPGRGSLHISVIVSAYANVY